MLRVLISRRFLAVVAVVAFTGCPYTDGCDASDDARVEGGVPADDAGDAGIVIEDAADAAPTIPKTGPAALVDFGQAPVGGPALSTLVCPELTMPPATEIATVFVDGAAAGAEEGTMAAPFHTLVTAFTKALPRAIVWVAAGTYREDVPILDKDLVVRGGFVPAFASRTDACATIIESPDPTQAVFAAGPEVKSFTLEGVTVQKGGRGITAMGDGTVQATFTVARCVFAENGQITEVGGALDFENVNARVFGSVFHDNRASKGAAIAITGDVTLTADQNDFLRNLGYSDHGGALYLSPKSGVVFRNTFRGNATGVGSKGVGGSWGGAAIVYKNDPQPTKVDFSFNVFTENLAGIGAAVFVDDGASVTLSHDLIYRNRAYPENVAGGTYVRGPALYVDGTGLNPAGGSSLTGEFLTVANNVYDDTGKVGTAHFGGNVYVEGFSKATISNSIFWNNGSNAFFVEANNLITVTNSIGATGCTTADFQGLKPAGADLCKIGPNVFLPAAIEFVNEAADDYHEKSTAGHWSNGTWVLDAVTSPAIDMADPTVKVGNEPVPNGARANLGCFARTNEASKSP